MAAPATGPISGNEGKVFVDSSEFADVTSWTLSDTADNKAYVSSSTNKQTRRKPGNFDATGTFVALLQQGKPPSGVAKGCIIAVELITFGGNKFAGNVIIDSRDFGADIGDGALLEVTVNFSQDDALVETIV